MRELRALCLLLIASGLIWAQPNPQQLDSSPTSSAAELMALREALLQLDRIKKEHPLLHTIQSDVSDSKAIAALCERVSRDYPALNNLINNAGVIRKINFQDKGSDHRSHPIKRYPENCNVRVNFGGIEDVGWVAECSDASVGE